MKPFQNYIAAFDHSAPCPSPDSYAYNNERRNLDQGYPPMTLVVLVLLFNFIVWVCCVCKRRRELRRETHDESTDDHDHDHGQVRRLNTTLPPATANSSSKGLDPTAIMSLPIYSYCRGEEEALDSIYANLYQIESCAICLTEFEAVNKVKVIPFCKHVFHPDCLDTWLSAHSTCPICRSKIDVNYYYKEKKIMCEGEDHRRSQQQGVNVMMSTTDTRSSSSGHDQRTCMTTSMAVGNVHDHVCIEIHDHL